MKGLRLPKRVRCFPGWNIKVKQATKKWLREAYALNAGDVIEGIWDIDAMTVYVQKTLPAKRKFKVFAHELVHCLNDWQAWVEDLS